MNAGLGRRLVFGFSAQACTMLVEIGLKFLMVPLYLYAWGVATYEDWLLLGAVANFSRLFDLGMEYHFGNAIRLSLARGDRGTFNRSLSIGITCYAVVALLLVLASLLAFLAPLHEVLNIATASPFEAALIFFLLMLQHAIVLPRPFIRSIYAAHGEFSRGENMYTILSLGMALTNAGMLTAGARPLTVAAVGVPAAALYCWAIMLIDQRRRYRDVRYAPGLPTAVELRAVIRNARYYMMPLWAEKALQQAPVLMLGVFVQEAGGVLVFTLARTLTGLARQGAAQLARSGGIEMARQVAQRDRAGAMALYRTLGRSIGGLTGLGCGLILIAAEPIMAAWTGSRVQADPLVVLAFVAGVLFAGPAQANLMLLQLTNVPRPLALSSLLQLVLVIGLGLPLIALFGALGSAVAVGLADALAIGVVINEAAARRFGLSASRYAAAAYGSELGGLLIGTVAASMLIRVFPAENIHQLVELFAVWATVVSLPALFILLNARQRRRILGVVHSVRGIESVSRAVVPKSRQTSPGSTSIPILTAAARPPD
jgi:O-antigen/teichoic acid export membrane protein